MSELTQKIRDQIATNKAMGAHGVVSVLLEEALAELERHEHNEQAVNEMLEYVADPRTESPLVLLDAWMQGAWDTIAQEWPESDLAILK